MIAVPFTTYVSDTECPAIASVLAETRSPELASLRVRLKLYHKASEPTLQERLKYKTRPKRCQVYQVIDRMLIHLDSTICIKPYFFEELSRHALRVVVRV